MPISDPMDSACYVLWQLSHTMQQRMSAALDEIGLNLPQLGALAHIARNDAISTADLARLTLMTPQNMSLTVAKLEAMGLVARRPDPVSARISRLRLTPAGDQAVQSAVGCALSVEAAMLEGMPAGDHAKLLRIMRRALDNLRQRHAKGDAS